MFNNNVRKHPKIIVEKSILSKLDLLPSQIRNNPRSNLFPELVIKSANSVRSGMWAAAYEQIKLYESNQYLSCKNIKIKDVINSHEIKESNNDIVANEDWKIYACGTQKVYNINYIATELDEFYADVKAKKFTDRYGELKKSKLLSKIFE